MSIISASTTTTTALQYTADTTGTLVFKTGATPTTALTLNADQSATFAGTVNFATAGFTNLSYTGTLTGGTGVVNLGSGQFYKDATGNVGIGTTSPLALLHLAASSGARQRFQNIGVKQWSIGNNSEAFTFVDETSAAERMRIDSSGNVGIGTNSPVSGYGSGKSLMLTNQSSVLFENSSNTWSTTTAGGGVTYFSNNFLYLDAKDSSSAIIFRVNGATERMRIDASGNLLVGTSTSRGRLTVNCGVSDNDFIVGYDITGTKHIASRLAYDRTTAAAANLVVDDSVNNYVIRRSTSSLKYKTDVTDTPHGLAEVLKLRSVTYKGKNDGDIVFGGLIAEEVDAAGLKEFVQYAKDGSPDSLAYGNMVSLCVKAIQELNAKVDAQAAEIAALKGTK